jgi:hypothetical protein
MSVRLDKQQKRKRECGEDAFPSPGCVSRPAPGIQGTKQPVSRGPSDTKKISFSMYLPKPIPADLLLVKLHDALKTGHTILLEIGRDILSDTLSPNCVEAAACQSVYKK